MAEDADALSLQLISINQLKTIHNNFNMLKTDLIISAVCLPSLRSMDLMKNNSCLKHSYDCQTYVHTI